jgi:hypothetical protein
MNPRWRLILASAAFVAWLSYLGYAALSKNRGPVISRAQAAAAKHAFVARIEADDAGKPKPIVKVVSHLRGDGPPNGSEQFIANLPDAQGFDGAGDYLLLVVQDPIVRLARADGPATQPFMVQGQQRSPGNDLSGVGKPLIYRWTDEVRNQFEKLPKGEP